MLLPQLRLRRRVADGPSVNPVLPAGEAGKTAVMRQTGIAGCRLKMMCVVRAKAG